MRVLTNGLLQEEFGNMFGLKEVYMVLVENFMSSQTLAAVEAFTCR